MELLERADDVVARSAALDAAARGTGSVALVPREAGIGESALVGRLAADATAGREARFAAVRDSGVAG